MFAVVLVCLENFQEYILTNIAQLIKFGHTNIYVITNNHLMQEFESLSDMIHLISVETLNDPFEFAHKSTVNKEFRNGFLHHASARLFVLHSFMVNCGVNNVIHIENDVLLYYNCDEILTDALHDSIQMYIPFDTYERNLGEKEIGQNFETTLLETTSLYNHLLLLRKNNTVIDLTKDVLTAGNPDFNDFLTDIEIINDAICNVTFGIGGPFTPLYGLFAKSHRGCSFL